MIKQIMQKFVQFFPRTMFYLGSGIACLFLVISTGCVSGGFKLTRQYASWVNSNHIVIRIILYILTSIVFFVTLVVDAVVFNTMDFWEGKVSQGTYEFTEGEKTFVVQHQILPDTHLRQSKIKVLDKLGSLEQTLVISESNTGRIELHVDGKLRTQVTDISTFPMLTLFNADGEVTENHALLFYIPLQIAQIGNQRTPRF